MEKPDTPPREKHPLAETFERIWSQALLAVSTAEEEAAKTAQRVAGLAGWSQEEVKRQGRLLTERLAGHRHALEHKVEDAVHHALQRLKVPRRDDLQEFQTRLDKVAERLEALGQRK